MVYMYTFVVTNMDSSPEYLIKFYCKRGLMENFIKESKSGFDFASVSSHTRIANANRLQVHALAYNIFNWFRRLALSANMRKQRIDTVRNRHSYSQHYCNCLSSFSSHQTFLPHFLILLYSYCTILLFYDLCPLITYFPLFITYFNKTELIKYN